MFVPTLPARKYVIATEVWISSAHQLINTGSMCDNLHGHNWKITVVCGSDTLDPSGMVVDFGYVKKLVKEFDHQFLNKIMRGSTTAENFAKYLCDRIPRCLAIAVQETEGNTAWYMNPNQDTT